VARSGGGRANPDEHHVLSTRTIVGWAAGLLLVAGLSVAALWTALGSGDPRDAGRLDTIKTASNIVVGTGGAAALLLAARRQRSAELDLKQKDHDATERRVTELYGKAADQLGSGNAPVRLAGLYALERLAQGSPAHRQTIVNLICAYLRMPFEPPASPTRPSRRPGLRPRGSTGRMSTDAAQELEVRQTAQSILAAHLRPGDGDDTDVPVSGFWPDMDLKLSGATLVYFSLSRCVLRSAAFHGSVFVGPTVFRGATFTSTADLREARFAGMADFRRVTFVADAWFRGAVFDGEVDFGTRTTATLTDVTTSGDPATRRKWPAGWVEAPVSGDSGRARLVSADRSAEPQPNGSPIPHRYAPDGNGVAGSDVRAL